MWSILSNLKKSVILAPRGHHSDAGHGMWDCGARGHCRASIGNRLHGAGSRSRIRAGAGRGGSERGGDPAIDRIGGFKRACGSDCRGGPEIG